MKKIELSISLKNIEPRVLRVIRIPFSVTFHELHQIIQLIFPWKNKHLYKFLIKNPDFEIVSDREVLKDYGEYKNGNDKAQFEGFVKMENIYDVEIKSSYSTKLEEIITTNSKINYIYDFGDNWNHIIEVNKIVELNNDTEDNYEEVLSLEGICPPEDVGGVAGFNEIKAALFNESVKGHEIINDWAKSNGFISKEPKIEDLNKILNEVEFKNTDL